VAGSRYKPGVLPVLVLGVDRPALAAALAERGLAAQPAVAGPVAALIGEGSARPACPTIVHVATPEAACALLDGGIDDVALASDPDRLVAARLAALVRRSQPGVIQVGDLAIDTLDRRVTRAGRPLALLPREYALLLYLARHAGAAVDHATLHRAIWGRVFDPGTNVIAVHVSRLRAKLGDSPARISTERGRGYRLWVAPVARDDKGG
jgi:two-component system, OmpR family, response regulator